MADAYIVNKAKGWRTCRTCVRASCVKRKDKIAASQRDWQKRHLPQVYARNKLQSQRLRRLVLDHYGGNCQCCGEAEVKFLGVEHLNGGGRKHRKELQAAGTTIYLWLKKNNFPEGYSVLCHNCNIAKGLYGECPHAVNARQSA